MRERRDWGVDSRSALKFGRSRLSLFGSIFLIFAIYFSWYGAGSPKEDDVPCSG